MEKELIEITGGAQVDPETGRIVKGPQLSTERARELARKSWTKRRTRRQQQRQRFLEKFNLSEDQLASIVTKARTAVVLMEHVQEELASLEQGYREIIEDVENA